MQQRELFRQLVDHDSRGYFDATEGFEGPPHLGRHETDEAIRQAIHDGHVSAEPFGGDGSLSYWFKLKLTSAGLRELGEWPPLGGEYRTGAWDDRRWGRVSKPLLRELVDDPPHGGVMSRPGGSGDNADEWQRWTDLQRLLEAGLIQGDLRNGHLQDIRVTRQGLAALDPPIDDPLTRAQVDLDRGAKADAVTAAIDGALKPALHRLADLNSVQRTKRNGEDENLGVINQELKKACAYDKSHKAEVDSWLQIRNVVNHGEGPNVSDRRIERLIEGVAVFIEETSPT